MQIKTFGQPGKPAPIVEVTPPNTSAPVPPVIPPKYPQADTPVYTTPDPTPAVPTPDPVPTTTVVRPSQMSGQPVVMDMMSPSTANVMQAIHFNPQRNEYYMSQATNGSNGSRDPYETTVITRFDNTGKQLDKMVVTNAGHGTGMAVENYGSNKVVYIWLNIQTQNNDTYRFAYKSGTFTFSNLPSKTKLPRFGNGTPTYHLDWDADEMMDRRGAANGAMLLQKRKISEYVKGIDKVYGSIITESVTWKQGWASINDYAFILQGAPNGEYEIPPQPSLLDTYSWKTGQRVDRADLQGLGRESDGDWKDNTHEPEGLSMYRTVSTGKPNLIVGINTGKSNRHKWWVYRYTSIGSAPADYSGTPSVPSNGVFQVGVTKPSAANTGLAAAGIDRSTLAAYTGPTTITTNGTSIINKRIDDDLNIQASNVTIRNCWIRGKNTDHGSGGGLIKCQDNDARSVLIEFCDFEPRHPDETVTAIIGHDYTLRRCHIKNVVDGCGVYNTSNKDGDMKVLIEANFIHDLTYFTGTATGQSDKRTHNDGIQVQGGKGWTIRGNTILGNVSTSAGLGAASKTDPTAPNPYYPSVTGQPIGLTSNVGKGPMTGLIEKNWIDYGQASINSAANDFGGYLGSIKNNKFGNNQWRAGGKQKAILIDSPFYIDGIARNSNTAVKDTNGNVFESTGAAVTIYRS